MAFCKNCGAYIPDKGSFCSSCGTPVEKKDYTQDYKSSYESRYDYSDNNNYYNNNPNIYENTDEQDVKNNRIMAALSYLGIFVLIPVFTAKNSSYAQFHASQGVNLFIVNLAYSLFSGIVKIILGIIYPAEYFLLGKIAHPITSGVSTVLDVLSFVFVIFSIIGIFNALSGNRNKLPFIGDLEILNKFNK
ncbi:MAG: zinc ribbon domain-containing protein [Ruminococcus sp.]|nr:zinc ribbon domain-containing protein [Ruminococcus sp.]